MCFAILLHLCKSLIERCTQKRMSAPQPHACAWFQSNSELKYQCCFLVTGKKVRLNMNLSIAISRFLRPFTINFESSRHQASWTTSFTHACIFESMSYWLYDILLYSIQGFPSFKRQWNCFNKDNNDQLSRSLGVELWKTTPVQGQKHDSLSRSNNSLVFLSLG